MTGCDFLVDRDAAIAAVSADTMPRGDLVVGTLLAGLGELSRTADRQDSSVAPLPPPSSGSGGAKDKDEADEKGGERKRMPEATAKTTALSGTTTATTDATTDEEGHGNTAEKSAVRGGGGDADDTAIELKTSRADGLSSPPLPSSLPPASSLSLAPDLRFGGGSGGGGGDSVQAAYDQMGQWWDAGWKMRPAWYDRSRRKMCIAFSPGPPTLGVPSRPSPTADRYFLFEVVAASSGAPDTR
jgi:hypothetical protein